MVTIIGLGFVGLTTALGFSEKSQRVYGFDIDQNKLKHLENKKVPFHEPYLKEKLVEHLGHNFYIIDNIEIAIKNSKVIFICVGTPSNSQGEANLNDVFNAIDSILNHNDDSVFRTIVIKSTVPPGTTKDEIVPYIESKGYIVGEDIGVVNNPEFLREGSSWEDFMFTDRIVIGESDERSGRLVGELYQNFSAPIFRVSLNSGEFIKYLSNTLLSTMISYSNDMSILAGIIGDINIKEAFKILHLDKRWSGKPASMKNYVYPGCGFGGYCLTKDTIALHEKGKQIGYESSILKAVLEINEKIKIHLIDRISHEIEKDTVIGILGLAFKPGTDDVRESPARDIISILIEKGYKNLFAYDPIANNNFRSNFNFGEVDIYYIENFEKICIKCDVLIIVTAWNEFKEKKEYFTNKKIFDCRYYL